MMNRLKNPMALNLLLGLFFLAGVGCKLREPSGSVKQIMVVMDIIPGTIGESYNKVVFQRSQRVFLISKKAKTKYHNLLRESKEKGTSVVIVRSSDASNEILKVFREDH